VREAEVDPAPVRPVEQDHEAERTERSLVETLAPQVLTNRDGQMIDVHGAEE
jgi:hypothetical protein